MTTTVLPGCEPFSVTGTTNGVLVLHGFTGNPQTMRALAEVVANQGYSVEMPRLPGHGTSLEDMMTTTWDDWSGTALASFDELAARCDHVAIVGLSMGGALALWVAQRRDSTGLVLINPLVEPPAQETLDGLRQLLDGGIETIESIGSDIKKEDAHVVTYPGTPLRCAESLFAALGPIFNNLPTVSAPVLLFSSREDHVVTSDNGDVVVNRVVGPVERWWLENSFHVATLDNDAPEIEGATVSFLGGLFSS
jgi:carboxylesterase